MDRSATIFVAGHQGLVGSAILRRLRAESCTNLLTQTRAQLDLTRAEAVARFFELTRPQYVFLAAARVGGIHANSTRPAEFIRENLLIQTHVIDAASRHGIRKLLFLGSSCIYPREAPQPIREDALLTGPLEPTNSAYALAKLAGIEMCRAYRQQHGLSAICLMPTNLYGPCDNFDPESSHVLPALIRRFHEARRDGTAAVRVWGSGRPRREFLYVDDLADAAVFFMERYDDAEIINVGTGSDVTIAELAALVAEVVGFRGVIEFDASRPDGTPRKLLDVSKLARLGWRARTALREGIGKTYAWFRERASGASAPALNRGAWASGPCEPQPR